MTALQVAIDRRRWDLVWLYLLLGVSEAASRLPRESLAELIELLAEGGRAPRRRHTRGA
jgi:hypothetical protein